ncbi:MAG: lectin like domain-containing protein [Oscillospiraceae bacterium]|nr:lectin like domain-containing protein [Oscillospiraceae bacterium]
MKKISLKLKCLALFVALILSFHLVSFGSDGHIPEINTYNIISGEPAPGGGYKDDYYVDEAGNVAEPELSFDAKRQTMRTSAVLPASYDLRDYGKITSVKYQGEAGCCWAFATIGSLESSMLMQGYGTFDFSEAHLSWFAQNQRTTNTSDPTYGDGVNHANPFTAGGNWNRATAAIVRGAGLELEANKPFYTSASNFHLMQYPESDRYVSYGRMMSARRLADSNAMVNRDELKSAIMSTGALAASYCSIDGGYRYQYPAGGQSTSYYQNINFGVTNHGVMLVGWNDNYPVSNFNSSMAPSQNGAWLCKNSWSTAWGNGGYFWMSYEEPSLSTVISYEAGLADEYEYTYQYDGTGMEGFGNFGYYYLRMANVFTASRNEQLTHVGFYNVNSDINYTVDIYTDVTGTTSPTTGTRVASAQTSGLASHYGYYAAELASPVTLAPGQRFSAVVTLYYADNRSAIVYAPIEGATNPHTAASGQSFVSIFSPGSSPGNTWYDTTSSMFSGAWNNLCVKAMTSSIPAIKLGLKSPSTMTIDAGDNIVFGLTTGKTVSHLLAEFKTVPGHSIYAEDRDGNLLSGSDRVKTGCKLVLSDGANEVDTLTFSLIGDVSCDGNIDGIDAVLVTYITDLGLNKAKIGAAAYRAADANHDGFIDHDDYLLLEQCGLLTATVSQVS